MKNNIDEKESTEQLYGRRQFLGELIRRVEFIIFGTAVGIAAIDMEELIFSPTPTEWLGPEGDYSGV